MRAFDRKGYPVECNSSMLQFAAMMLLERAIYYVRLRQRRVGATWQVRPDRGLRMRPRHEAHAPVFDRGVSDGQPARHCGGVLREGRPVRDVLMPREHGVFAVRPLRQQLHGSADMSVQNTAPVKRCLEHVIISIKGSVGLVRGASACSR